MGILNNGKSIEGGKVFLTQISSEQEHLFERCSLSDLDIRASRSINLKEAIRECLGLKSVFKVDSKLLLLLNKPQRLVGYSIKIQSRGGVLWCNRVYLVLNHLFLVPR